jgi:hypothetical protein
LGDCHSHSGGRSHVQVGCPRAKSDGWLGT